MSDLYGKVRAINERVRPDDLNKGDLIIFDNQLKRIELFSWNRPCGWWTVMFQGEREEHHVYDEQTFNRVSLVLDLV